MWGSSSTLSFVVRHTGSADLKRKIGVSHNPDRVLGIVIDTERLELRLPEEKLTWLKWLTQRWRSMKSCTKQDLLSLIGQLQHACKVVCPGQTFLRRMIELSTIAKELYHHIRLNKEFYSDLEWWVQFLPNWNGVSMMSSMCSVPHSETVTADASGGWGCGAFSGAQWFQVEWPESWAMVHITVKELLPIVLTCALWSPQWKGKSVLCRSNNAAVVAVVNSGQLKAQDPTAMHLQQCIFFFAARDGYTLQAVHVAGKLNVVADALSRDNLPLFLAQVPGVLTHPTPTPHKLLYICHILLRRPSLRHPQVTL